MAFAYEECVLLAGNIYIRMLEQSGNDVVLSVTAKPNSRKFKLEIRGDKLIAWLESRAENNRANIELIKEMKRLFKKDVALISGEKSKAKKLKIINAAKEEIEKGLRQIAASGYFSYSGAIGA